MAADMPRTEVEASVQLVQDLLDDQRPDLSAARVTPLAFGWDNFSFRVGEDLVARLPRRMASVGLVENEAR